MTDSVSLEKKLQPYLDPNSPYKPIEAFGRFINSTLDKSMDPLLEIELILKFSEEYNSRAQRKRQIELFFHYTDDAGAEGIKDKQKIYGPYKLERIYLTKIPPDKVKAFMDQQDADLFEKYLKGEIVVDDFKRRLEKSKLDMKFKWKYSLSKFAKNIVPVGSEKVKNVVLLVVERQKDLPTEKRVIEKDEEGTFYTEHPITLVDDPNFYIFGPYDL